MTGKNLEIICQIVLWYENSFRIDCIRYNLKKHSKTKKLKLEFEKIMYM